ncbi:hypothetical protein [Longitalea luteola]|uniref:hypothetical protein n=1 Tax=Longitalea luteola TaxID=2812563 RepID=UPI001A96D1B8|nr:hypothetical protein [Longitalea luteola]
MITVLYLVLLTPVQVTAQQTIPDNKIDWPFRRLIAEQKRADSINQCSNRDTLVKKYDCIIHTTQPGALKKKGFTILAVSPRAVTARVTLTQLTIAAAMPEVKFIEAPEYLKMHPQ